MFASYIRMVYRPFQSLKNFNFTKRYTSSNLEWYEPPYLSNLKPKLPIYETVTIQIKGYDYPVLEHFQKFVHSVAEFMNLKVDMCWAHPATHYEVHRREFNSKKTDEIYNLLIYERNVKLTCVPAIKLPLLSEFIQAAMPEGTQLKIFPFDEKHANSRFVPDHDLIAKMKELEELGGPPEEE